MFLYIAKYVNVLVGLKSLCELHNIFFYIIFLTKSRALKLLCVHRVVVVFETHYLLYNTRLLYVYYRYIRGLDNVLLY